VCVLPGRFEFRVARQSLGAARLIPVVLEPECRASSDWPAQVCGFLGDRLYIDLCASLGVPEFDANITRLADEVRKVSSEAAAKAAHAEPSTLISRPSHPQLLPSSGAVEEDGAKRFVAQAENEDEERAIWASASGLDAEINELLDAAQVYNAARLQAAVEFCRKEEIVSLQELARFEEQLCDAICTQATLTEANRRRLREQLAKHAEPHLRVQRCMQPCFKWVGEKAWPEVRGVVRDVRGGARDGE
jgi:hypothetical protein